MVDNAGVGHTAHLQFKPIIVEAEGCPTIKIERQGSRFGNDRAKVDCIVVVDCLVPKDGARGADSFVDSEGGAATDVAKSADTDQVSRHIGQDDQLRGLGGKDIRCAAVVEEADTA